MTATLVVIITIISDQLMWLLLLVTYYASRLIDLALYSSTGNPKVIWEELRRHLTWQRITTPQSPHWLQWDAPYLPQKTAPFPSTISTSSNTPIPGLTPLTTPNGNQIQSVIFPRYTLRTHREMGLTISLYQHLLTLYWLYSDAANADVSLPFRLYI